MRSSKPRKIILKDAKLRKVRENLREIFRLAYLDEFKRLLKSKRLYQEKYIKNQYRLTPSQRKREVELSRIRNKLYHAFTDSILECSSGAACASFKKLVKKGVVRPSERPVDLNMVWLPHYKVWFCVKCYEEFFKVKVCENCREIDERMAKISECFICNRYICEFCENHCPECNELYCDQCYFEHSVQKKCCFSTNSSY